jgi:hypothetical protein
MTDQLQDLLPALEKLPPELQKEALTHIKALIEEMLQHSSIDRTNADAKSASKQPTWQDPFGAWSDLPDTMLDDLDSLRHASVPTPPLEQL